MLDNKNFRIYWKICLDKNPR